jgi:3-hydroxybutyryl-CoA dehydrogenase
VKALSTVAVIGNGIMGHGIAEVFATAGKPVTLVGRADASLARALENVRASLALFVENGLLNAQQAKDAIGRIRTTTALDDAKGAELVIEAVPEDMALKRAIFTRLDAICAPDAVLASSSGHPASALTEGVTRKARVIAAHFWFPPQLLPLVEVCGAPETSREVIDWTVGVLREAGKEPVVIDREIAGFIGNRIQFAALREAWSLWAQGVASAEAIDAVVRNSIGRRLGVTGPLETADLGGLDTFWHFARFLQPTLDTAALPPAQVGAMVEEGHRGASTGRGLHPWPGTAAADLLAARKAELIRWLKADRARRTPSESRK